MLVIDYIQLLQGSSASASESRVQEVTEITTGLKALAKELNVPIVALSQLSRQVESRDDKRPQLSDLRESGSIEQDADVVLFVFREEYYPEQQGAAAGHAKSTSSGRPRWRRSHGKAEVIIGKQRHGPTGTVQLQFEAAVTRFRRSRPPTICRSGSSSSRALVARGIHGMIRYTARHGPSAETQHVVRAAARTPPAVTAETAAGGRRHPHHRSRRHRANWQMLGAACCRANAPPWSRRRLWLRHRAGQHGARDGRLQDVLRRGSVPRRAALRSVAPEPAIYVLNGLLPARAAALRRNQRAPGDRQPGRARRMGRLLYDASGWRGGAALHVDTGMNRLGISVEEAAALAPRIRAENHGITLLMSHLACAETPEHPLNEQQIGAVPRNARCSFAASPARSPIPPASSSATPAHCDLVRPGVALYGVNPTPGKPNPMRPVVELQGAHPAGARRRQGRDRRLRRAPGRRGTQPRSPSSPPAMPTAICARRARPTRRRAPRRSWPASAAASPAASRWT